MNRTPIRTHPPRYRQPVWLRLRLIIIAVSLDRHRRSSIEANVNLYHRSTGTTRPHDMEEEAGTEVTEETDPLPWIAAEADLVLDLQVWFDSIYMKWLYEFEYI